jgi:hypothetical protein
MREAIAIASVALFFGTANASAEIIRQTGANITDTSKIDVQYYSNRYRARIRTFPSGQRYTSRGGPYVRYITPRGGRTGPIARSAHGG